MAVHPLAITYIGGATALLEFASVRFLTDPTFDPPGGQYPCGAATLHKLAGPAMSPDELGRFEYVLLSHEHHFDNLDRTGRALLPTAEKVLTTKEGAARLGGNAVGLSEWQSIDLFGTSGNVRVIATPARHGPAGLDRGPVVGFVLQHLKAPELTVYVSGDTVWYEDVAEVARRFTVDLAILHLGAARVPEVGAFHLTMTAEEGVVAARTFQHAGHCSTPLRRLGAFFRKGARRLRRLSKPSSSPIGCDGLNRAQKL